MYTCISISLYIYIYIFLYLIIYIVCVLRGTHTGGPAFEDPPRRGRFLYPRSRTFVWALPLRGLSPLGTNNYSPRDVRSMTAGHAPLGPPAGREGPAQRTRRPQRAGGPGHGGYIYIYIYIFIYLFVYKYIEREIDR